MQAIDIYLKVQADLDDSENAKRFADELCRVLQRIYGVRSAEVSNVRNLAEES